jgi:hypothetical protein
MYHIYRNKHDENENENEKKSLSVPLVMSCNAREPNEKIDLPQK